MNEELHLYTLRYNDFLPGMLPDWVCDGIKVRDEAAARKFIELSQPDQQSCWAFAATAAAPDVWGEVAAGQAICSEKITAACRYAMTIKGSLLSRLTLSRQAAAQYPGKNLSFAGGALKLRVEIIPCEADNKRSSDWELQVSGTGIAENAGCDLKNYVSRSGSLSRGKFDKDFPALVTLWKEWRSRKAGGFMRSHPLDALYEECYDMLNAARKSVEPEAALAAGPDTPWGTKLFSQICYQGGLSGGVDTYNYLKKHSTPQLAYDAWVAGMSGGTGKPHFAGCMGLDKGLMAKVLARALTATEIGVKFDPEATVQAWHKSGFTCTCSVKKLMARIDFKIDKYPCDWESGTRSDWGKWTAQTLSRHPGLGEIPALSKSMACNSSREDLLAAMAYHADNFWSISRGAEEVRSEDLANWCERGRQIPGTPLWMLERCQELVRELKTSSIPFGDDCRLELEIPRLNHLRDLSNMTYHIHLHQGTNKETIYVSSFHSVWPHWDMTVKEFRAKYQKQSEAWSANHPQGQPETLHLAINAAISALNAKLAAIKNTPNEAENLVPGHPAWEENAPLVAQGLRDSLQADAALGISLPDHEPGCTGKPTVMQHLIERLALLWRGQETPIDELGTIRMLQTRRASCSCKALAWLEQQIESDTQKAPETAALNDAA